jgi:hypothetical protein
VPWLRRLVDDLLPWRPVFTPGSIRVGFVVEKVALGQVFLPSSSIFSCQYYFTVALHTHISCRGLTIDPLAAAVQRHRLTHRHEHEQNEEKLTLLRPPERPSSKMPVRCHLGLTLAIMIIMITNASRV